MTMKMFMIPIVLLQMFMSMMTMALTKTMTMAIRMARAFLRRVSSEVKNRALGEMLCAPVIGKVKAWGDSSPELKRKNAAKLESEANYINTKKHKHNDGGRHAPSISSLDEE